MYRFQNSQGRFEISGVGFGGQPGERRTVMIGSLFYPGHTLVRNRKRGSVDTEALEKLIDNMRQAGEITGTPSALMLYAETEEAMVSYLGLMTEMVDLPLFLDSPSREVKLAGVRVAGNRGLADRIVYNTLGVGTSEEELTVLRDSGVSSAVLLAFNPRDVGLKGKIYLLENGGGMMKTGLIEKVREAGINRPLLDMAVMSMDQRAGSALKGITLAKAKWGLPSGCALHNAVESWDLPSLREDKTLFRYVDLASVAIPIMSGADFVMFGPVEYSMRTFHVAAFTDALIEQAVAER